MGRIRTNTYGCFLEKKTGCLMTIIFQVGHVSDLITCFGTTTFNIFEKIVA